MKTGLPKSINATSEDATRLLRSAATTRMSNVPATATNGALLPATTTTTTTSTMAATTTAATLTASAGTLLPTTTGVARHDATLTFPTMAPGLLQAPQQYPVYFLPHPVYTSFQLPVHRLPYYIPPLIVRPPVGVARKRKPQVESHCCKRYWKYHAIDKPEGAMGAPPHCLDCPVRKQRRRPNNGPQGPH